MKKTLTRILSVFLILALIIVMIPINVFAEKNDGSVSAKASNVSVSGTDGFGSVIAKASAGAEEDDPDYGIEDFYLVENNIAYVKFHNVESCKLVVALYSEETGQMLGSGMKNVSAHETEANIIIDVESIPQYYILKAYLLDENNAPLGKSQFNIETTKMFEKFDSKTVDDFSNNVVLNFDDQKDDNFAVLLDNAVDIKYDGISNVLDSYDENAGKYIFSNVNENIRNLKIGDIFTFTIEPDIYIIKIASISFSQDKATIIEDKDTTYEDLFKYIDLNINSNETENGIKYDQSNANPNIELVGYEKWDEGNDYGLNGIETQAEIIDIDKKVNVSCPVFQTKEKNGYLVGNKDSHFSIRGSADLKLSGDITVKCYYDTEWNWSVDYVWFIPIPDLDIDNYFYFKLEINLKLKGSINFTIKLQGDINITKLSYWITGLVIEGDVTLHFEASLTFSASIEIKWTIGFNYDTDSGWTNLSGWPKANLYPKGALTSAVIIAVKFKPGLSLAKVIKGSLLTEVGVELVTTIVDLDSKEILNATKVEKIHLCDWEKCFEGDINIYLAVKISGEIFGKTFGVKELKPKTSTKLFDYYFRTYPQFEFHLTECPNYAFRCDMKILNKDNKPIVNVDVLSDSKDISEHYKYNQKNATDNNGCVSFFYMEGEYTPTFYINGNAVDANIVKQKVFNKVVQSQSFKMIDAVKTITFILDVTETDGGGSGHNSGGGGTNLFNYSAVFNANGGLFPDGTVEKTLTIKSGEVIVPPSTPTKSGYIFTGWSPNLPDVMPSKDQYFTATWDSGTVSQSFSGSTLTISGTGCMTDYTGFGQAPWNSYKGSIKHIVIESGVTGLGDYAFAQCENLETVTIADTVTDIGTATFYQCDSLQSINLPDSVKTIDDYAFYGCYSMKTLSLGSVESIGSYAFAQCTALENVVVPATTTNIGDSAFAWCQNLDTIEIKNKNCGVYDSSNTIYVDTTIIAPVGSKAQSYANKYGRTFSSLTTQSVIDTTKVYDSFLFTYSSCVAGSDYILLNVTGYGNGFELTTSNLEFIDQITADSNGKITRNFIPRKLVLDSTTLLIGDFGNGTEAKIIKPTLVSTNVEINNNPGTLKINYQEGVKLTATVISPIDDCNIQWYVNDSFYCAGDTFECKHIKSDIKVTAKLVDINGNPIIKDGKEISAEETVKVNASFIQKIIAFFKFTLFRQVVIRTN